MPPTAIPSTIPTPSTPTSLVVVVEFAEVEVAGGASSGQGELASLQARRSLRLGEEEEEKEEEMSEEGRGGEEEGRRRGKKMVTGREGRGRKS